VRKNLAPRDVADAAEAQSGDREEMTTWTPEQLRRFFDGIAITAWPPPTCSRPPQECGAAKCSETGGVELRPS
jgi:hypothetical protein